MESEREARPCLCALLSFRTRIEAFTDEMNDVQVLPTKRPRGFIRRSCMNYTVRLGLHTEHPRRLGLHTEHPRPAAALALSKARKKRFIHVWKKNLWASSESRSGRGSERRELLVHTGVLDAVEVCLFGLVCVRVLAFHVWSCV